MIISGIHCEFWNICPTDEGGQLHIFAPGHNRFSTVVEKKIKEQNLSDLHSITLHVYIWKVDLLNVYTGRQSQLREVQATLSGS